MSADDQQVRLWPCFELKFNTFRSVSGKRSVTMFLQELTESFLRLIVWLKNQNSWLIYRGFFTIKPMLVITRLGLSAANKVTTLFYLRMVE